MERLAVFKIDKQETMIFCGIFSSKEDAIKYLENVKNLIDNQLQVEFKGEYIIVPTIYFNI